METEEAPAEAELERPEAGAPASLPESLLPPTSLLTTSLATRQLRTARRRRMGRAISSSSLMGPARGLDRRRRRRVRLPRQMRHRLLPLRSSLWWLGGEADRLRSCSKLLGRSIHRRARRVMCSRGSAHVASTRRRPTFGCTTRLHRKATSCSALRQASVPAPASAMQCLTRLLTSMQIRWSAATRRMSLQASTRASPSCSSQRR